MARLTSCALMENCITERQLLDKCEEKARAAYVETPDRDE